MEHALTLNLINDADILLRTTLFDGDAISVREALFLGTQVIATDNGMRPRRVHLIQPGDFQELVKKIREASSISKEKALIADPDISNITKVIDLYKDLL